MSAHLLVAISSHGYGHAAQLAPVVARILARDPTVHASLAGALPSDLLRAMFGPSVKIVPPFEEAGMAMASAIDVLAEASAARYAALHEGWERRIARAVRRLGELAPDLILANIPCLPLAAGRLLGVPSIALSSLNWADIYRAYCGARPEAARIVEQMRAAYAGADLFLAPAPALPMDDLDTRPIGPIARLGRDRRDEIAQAFGLDAGERLVLVSLGGLGFEGVARDWPARAGWRWVLPGAAAEGRADALAQEAVEARGMSFIDLLCSVDALITKPGYGAFAEAGCNGVPVLYVCRGDWPEEPYLTDWLARAVPAREIGRAEFASGALVRPLEALLAMPRGTPPVPSGIETAVAEIARRLAR